MTKTPASPLCAEGHHLECQRDDERGPFSTPPHRRDCHCPCHAPAHDPERRP